MKAIVIDSLMGVWPGGGSVLRLENGYHIANHCSSYGKGTSNMALTRVILHGIKLCKVNGITEFMIQTNYILEKIWFKREWGIPHYLKKWLDKIWEE